jgi:hypothetical protein
MIIEEATEVTQFLGQLHQQAAAVVAVALALEATTQETAVGLAVELEETALEQSVVRELLTKDLVLQLLLQGLLLLAAAVQGLHQLLLLAVLLEQQEALA